MLSLIDPAAMLAALPTLAPLPRRRVQEILDGQLADMTHILIIGPDDTEAVIVAEIGFSPLKLERLQFSDSGLEPAWDDRRAGRRSDLGATGRQRPVVALRPWT